MFWLQCYICQFFYIIFGERWSIEWWISVVWQQPKVWRILREGWVVGHAIGNWRGNWDGTFHHFLGRFLCGFGCIPPNWQILVPWLWLHTTLLPLALLHKEMLYKGLTDSGKCNWIRNTIKYSGIYYLHCRRNTQCHESRSTQNRANNWLLEFSAIWTGWVGWGGHTSPDCYDY